MADASAQVETLGSAQGVEDVPCLVRRDPRVAVARHQEDGLAHVRGAGMLIGLEFADAASCVRAASRAFAEGLILNWTLHRDTVIRLAPPLVLSDEEAADAIERLARALG